MISKVNNCSLSFGTVSDWAARIARENKTDSNVEDLVDSQKNNLKYHVVDTIDEKMYPCFGVDLNGNILERFSTLAAACSYATAAEKAAKDNNAF